MAGVPIGAPGSPSLPLSKGVRAGDFVFVSGQVGIGPDGQIVDSLEGQIRQSIENGRSVLREVGLDLADVVKTTVWLTRVEDFAEFNGIYAEYFSEGPPARSTVASDLMLPGLVFEIEMIAYSG